MSALEERIRVLIIEDNMGDLLLISEYLEDEFSNLQIEHSRTCKDAKMKISNDFNVILLDLSLPDKSGEQLVNEIITAAGDVPVIVLTGYSDKNFAIKSIGLGTSDYLLKDELKPDSLQKSVIYSIERKKFFNQLEHSEKRYKDLFHLSPIPMYVFDKKSLRFLDVNQATIKQYGYKKEEFLDMTLEKIRLKEDLPNLKESLKKLSNGDDLKSGHTIRHVKKTGEIIDVEISANHLEFNGVPAYLIMANDVTEKRQYIQAIEEQNTKLKEISWIQSHVVRAPLARMVGLINLLSDEDLTEPERAEYLKHVISSGNELDQIIRKITGKTEQINIPKK